MQDRIDVCFFFSSRRRHTRLQGDWSSDVCSSDLATRSLAYLDDFVAWAERPESHIVADGEVVFVGYGIEASEWQWDDYKGADVRGKVLVMLVNDPGLQDSTIFNGRALTYYGRWTYKLEEAARRGALGSS